MIDEAQNVSVARRRSATLRINYRTSHQIRTQADRFLGKQIADVDGNIVASSAGVVGLACDDEVLPRQARIEGVAAWTRARDCLLATGITPASEFLQDLGR